MGGREEVVFSRLDPSMQFTRLNRLRLRPARMPRSKRVKPTSLKKKRNPSPTEMSVDSWSSPHETAAAAAPEPHAHSATHTPHHPDQDPDHDQDQDQDPHPDKLCLDSFWSEVETIRQGSGDPDQDPDQDQDQDQDQDPDQDRRDSRHSEEGEQEEQWLAEAGLSTLLKEDSVEEVGEEVLLLSTLTRTQAEAVQRRLDSYTLSLRKRNKPPPRDVRDIFNSPKKQSLRPERSEDSAHHSMASTKTPLAAQTVAPVEEFFLTDVAYCEQAVILLKQAKLPQNNSQRRREDGTLPRVICPKCRLGVTRIQDLSHGDMKKVRQLALIDMTALSDLLEIDVKRHKTGKRKNTESCLYGVPLVTLLENDQKIKANTTTPLYMQALLSFLEKKGVDSEGILRVPGSQSRIKLLQQHLESNFYSGHVIWEDVSPNDAAALLKKFIRELPAPLLTAEYLNTFSAVREITELRQKLHMLNLLILLLPEPNRNTLKALLEFLSKVVSREKKNRMNLWAVSTIMAPNLFLHKAVPSRLTDGAEKNQAEKAADVMRLLIRYQDLLWTIPNFLMRQVRKLNENSNKRYQFYDRRIKNLLRKIHTDSRDKPDKTTAEPCRTVKIQVGDHVTGSMEFQINVNSRASDLIAHFQRQNLPSPDHKGKVRRNGSMAFPDCSLYEVGGNIGEHCLDPDTHLLDLYNSNAGGEWVIRLKANASR